MYLQSLYLKNFRNYTDQWVEFNAPKTILVGQNAQGKSNLLEAIELLATLKSHRTSRDRDLIQGGQETGLIKARLERNYVEQELALTLRQSGRKNLSLNQENVRRQFDFLGVINAVQFSCLDLDIVRGAPEVRRHWLDTLLIQLEPIYSHILTQYQHILKQRNALLKKLRQQQEESQPLNTFDLEQLPLWDQQLAEMGSRVSRRRARVLTRLAPLAQVWHQQISGQTEFLAIAYEPNIVWPEDDPQSVQQAFLAKIEQRRIAEQQLGASVVGPHRDEIALSINQTPAKSYGSQGQQRTLVLALKLAELSLIEEVVGEPPLLLLDDVLAELDLQRQNQLLAVIQDRFQTLITTTHLQGFDDQWRKASQILTVQGGQICDNLG
ncbi:MAG: DNA replication/repair protein RecF [Woronichinia naegeliana WA131]|jgi:DNA replication and repair protein RecF|uniref:DNA replication and repair protein RecF n=1 Tax=Woronichinia naegeliana WA131 TaxID=2824559 RepID=A0A977L2A6_9CYAN|nr:MAG: DNA replication/repair protein RecF [Woronichinia naegeliana WA131]